MTPNGPFPWRPSWFGWSPLSAASSCTRPPAPFSTTPTLPPWGGCFPVPGRLINPTAPQAENQFLLSPGETDESPHSRRHHLLCLHAGDGRPGRFYLLAIWTAPDCEDFRPLQRLQRFLDFRGFPFLRGFPGTNGPLLLPAFLLERAPGYFGLFPFDDGFMPRGNPLEPGPAQSRLRFFHRGVILQKNG